MRRRPAGRYAEGLPGKRYYQGCDDFDTIETIGIDLAKKVFNANFANIQPISGTVANIAALKAMVKPGDRIPGLDRGRGTHFLTPRWAQWVCVASTLHTFPWNEDRMEPDIDAAAAMIRDKTRPCPVWASVFLFPHTRNPTRHGWAACVRRRPVRGNRRGVFNPPGKGGHLTGSPQALPPGPTRRILVPQHGGER
ncbi:MAG: hypothetical protein CM15mP18_1950 [Methanobacteriota archaeon]|nr:MAG: hypothetical protein CM15mP18_1950 [Euryarchaeota archaeon]